MGAARSSTGGTEMLVRSAPASMFTSESENTYNLAPRALTSRRLEFNLPNKPLFGATAITGMSSSIRAKGPCFSSPAA